MNEQATRPAIYIETAGCAFNFSDSEAMAGVLRRSGYELAESAESADLVILNTCTVKDRTVLDFQKRLRGLRSCEGAKPVVVAGCIPKANEKHGMLEGVPAIGPDAVGSIGDVVREALHGRAVQRLGREAAAARNGLPLVRRNPVVEILPISRGCWSACTFCQTRIARGRLVSFRPGDILDQARRALGEGVRIFWVTSQDTGAYGKDIDFSLPRLLNKLLELPGDFRVRLGMSSPRWIAERFNEYLDVFEHPKMFRFLHVPVQSGSERVVAHMRRDGTVAEFERIHDAFVSRFPQGSVLTDIIAGYPTETDEDFEATLALLRRVRLPGVNGSRFSARPGTAAAKLKPLPARIVSDRSRRLMACVKEISAEYHRARVGQEHEVVIEQFGPGGMPIGRTDAYRPVLFSCDFALGSKLCVRIERGEAFRFAGCAVN